MMRPVVVKALVTNSRVLVVNSPVTIQKRWESRPSDIKSNISSSTILIHDGISISEVPVAIRKVNDILDPVVKKNEHKKSFSNSDVFNLIHKEFLKCLNFQEVVTLLAKCSKITPNIAAGAVERIIKLREQGTNKSGQDINEVVLETLVRNLIESVMKSENAYTIINLMNAIPEDQVRYKNALCDALLEKVMDKALSVSQLCDVVEAFSQNTKYHKHLENTDKLWFGFVEMESNISRNEIVRCFQVLHHLKSSRRMIVNVLERRIDELWPELQTEEVITILSLIYKYNFTCPQTLVCIGRWLTTSIHTLNDKFMLDILEKFNEIVYTDTNIHKSIERYIKAKGIYIKSHMLIVAILNHCSLFRVRNEIILDGCADYIITNGNEIEAIYVRPLFYPFALLNYNPPNASKFWEAFEAIFFSRFHKMNKEDIIDLMMGCVYLQKYPLNFIDLVLNPGFLDKVNTLPRKDFIRNKMKIFDTAMAIECKAYPGPLLPKDHGAKSLYRDIRISRIINNMRPDIEQIAGGNDCYSSHVVLPNIFTTELYLVDIMLHPKGLKNSLLNFNMKKDRNICTALLINLPEHYCSNEDVLIGPQAMRLRHLKLLGLKVVTLKYETLSRLRMRKTELHAYIVDRIRNAEFDS